MDYVLFVEVFSFQGNSKSVSVPSMVRTQTSSQTKEATQANDCSAVRNLSEIRSKLPNPGIIQMFSQPMGKVKVFRGLKSQAGLLLNLPNHASPLLSPCCGSNPSVIYLNQSNSAEFLFSKGNCSKGNLFDHTAALAEHYFKSYASTSSSYSCFKNCVP